MSGRLPFDELALALLLFASLIVKAADEKVESRDLPPAVTEALDARFPGLKIVAALKEKKNGGAIYDIELTHKGKKFETDIKEDGSMIEVEKEVSRNNPPKVVQSYLKEHHANNSIKAIMEVCKVRDKKEVADHYEVVIEGEDAKEIEFLLTLDGKPMKDEDESPSKEEKEKEGTEEKGEESIDIEKLPAAVTKAIKSKFPKADIKSAVEGDEDGKEIYEVSIKHDDHYIDVTLSEEGQILSWEKALVKSEYPKAIKDTLEGKYSTAKVKAVEELWEGDKLSGYEVILTLNGKAIEVLFDAKGREVEKAEKNDKK